MSCYELPVGMTFSKPTFWLRLTAVSEAKPNRWSLEVEPTGSYFRLETFS